MPAVLKSLISLHFISRYFISTVLHFRDFLEKSG